MSRIEELPDNFDESINLNETPPASEGADEPPATEKPPFPINEEKLKELENDPTAPKMPPSMASVKSHTTDELWDMMNKTPLFMTDIDKAGDEYGQNELLDAIQAIQNEGTRGDVAQNFREQGNEAAKEKRWVDAKEFYSKAIAVLQAKIDQWEKPKDPKEEQKLLHQVEEASFINRALCNLELKNYRSTTLDCASALRVNPGNIKAFYRSSAALLALDKIPEAEDAVTRGLAVDSGNKPLQQLATKIGARKGVVELAAAKKRAEEGRARKTKQVLNAALHARHIRTRRTGQPPEMDDAGIRLVPDPLSPESSIEFPAVFLFPMHAQSDFIKSFSELSSIADHLEYVFPLPWDEKKEYTLNGVECFMETVTKGLIKAGKKVPLLQILSGGKVEVVDELVRIYVVPTAKTGKFIAEMKARKESS